MKIKSPKRGRFSALSMLTEAKRVEVGLARFLPAIPIPDFLVLCEIRLPRLEVHEVLSESSSSGHTCTANEAGTSGSDDTAIKVRSQHNVELFRRFDNLHGSVVDYHLFVLDHGEPLGLFSAAFQEKSIYHLHNVGLVNSSDFLSAVEESAFEGVFGDSLGLLLGDNLKTLEDTRVNFVFDAGVLTFEVFSDDHDVDWLFVAHLDIWQLEQVDN